MKVLFLRKKKNNYNYAFKKKKKKKKPLTCQEAILQWSFLLTQQSVFHESLQFDASYLSVPGHPE